MSVSLEYVRDSIVRILKTTEYKNLLNGVLASYNVTDEDGVKTTTMQVLPLEIENIFPTIKEEINGSNFRIQAENIFKASRPNRYIFHKEHFLNKYKDKGHFELEIKPKSIVKYDSEKIKIGNNKYGSLNNYLETVINEVNKSEGNNYERINSIDQCYFSSGCKKLLVIPIPLLSTPVFLLVLDAKNLKDNRKVKLIQDVYNLTKVTVRHFILTNLIDGLKSQIANNLDSIKTAKHLIEHFNEELCKILLPIEWEIAEVLELVLDNADSNYICKDSYKCEECQNKCGKSKGSDTCENIRYLYREDNKKQIVRICHEKTQRGNYLKDNWPFYCDTDEEGILKENIYYFHFFVSLNDEDQKQYIISLKQTSFKFPVQNGKETEYQWVQSLSDYEIAASQLGTMLSSIFNLIYNQWKEIQKVKVNATRAAISQVMARNMSHNIGSHVLSKLIKDTQVKEIKKYLENATNYYQCKTKIANDQDYSNDELVAKFFNYLKTRMDYLADVTTNTPVIENANNFYDNIVKPFVENRVLNDRISGITTFDYEIILCKPESNGGCKEISTTDCNCQIPCFQQDIQVSIPNDVVGIHAFYTILENIIRNTARHSKKPESGNVEFKIKIEEASNYQKQDIEIDWNAYYAISVFDNCPVQDIVNLVISQNKKLNETILKDNKLRHGHWGLIEMDASAAYLRKIPVEHIDSDDYDIEDFSGQNPITKGGNLAIFQAYSEQGRYLGYRFFLRKPQEILIIVKDEDDKNDLVYKSGKKITVLVNEGVWLKTEEEIDFDIKENIASPHRLIAMTSKAAAVESKVKNNPLFSKRHIQIEEPNYKKIFDKDKTWNDYYGNKKKYMSNEPCRYVNGDQDDHGSNYCDYLYGEKKKDGSHGIGNKFVEIKFSATAQFSNNKNYIYSWPIRIGIIDERVQSFTINEKYPIQENDSCSHKVDGKCYHTKGEIPYADLYKNTNILVPSIDDCDLNKQDFSIETNEGLILTKIIQYIIKCTKIAKKESEEGNGLYDSPCEFILIHIGIIEKLMKSWNEKNNILYDKDSKNSVKKFIEEVILLKTNDKKTVYDSLIITSGRGKPQNLPDDIRYVNFSTVYQYLTVQRNKYALTEALFSARKQTKS